jgi:hypothetical protein
MAAPYVIHHISRRAVLNAYYSALCLLTSVEGHDGGSAIHVIRIRAEMSSAMIKYAAVAYAPTA